jgi:hypothetical protein
MKEGRYSTGGTTNKAISTGWFFDWACVLIGLAPCVLNLLLTEIHEGWILSENCEYNKRDTWDRGIEWKGIFPRSTHSCQISYLRIYIHLWSWRSFVRALEFLKQKRRVYWKSEEEVNWEQMDNGADLCNWKSR